MGRDIVDWAKDLKHNEKTAVKYKGVQTVEEILKLARQDGYNFSKSELLDFDLDSVAGGGGKKDNDFNGLGANVNTDTDTGLLHDNELHTGDIDIELFDIGDKIQQTINQYQQAQMVNYGAGTKVYYDHHGQQSSGVKNKKK